MKEFLLIIILIFTVCSCNNDASQKEPSLRQRSKNNAPAGNFNDDSILTISMKGWESSLNLDHFDFVDDDAIAMRIWLWGGYHDTTFVVSIYSSRTEKKYNITAGSLQRIGDTSSVIVKHFSRDYSNLASGWDSLLLVFKENIQYADKNETDSTLGTGLNGGANHLVQVSDSLGINYYTFFEPSFYRFVVHRSKKAHIFFTFLNRQFPVEVYKFLPNFFDTPDTTR